MQTRPLKIALDAAPWLGFFAAVLAAWAALFAMQPAPDVADLTRLYGSDFWASLCAPVTGASAFGPVFLMWALMSAAMMMPTLVPALKTYRNHGHAGASSGTTFTVMIAAYLVLWLGFSALAAGAQLTLARAGLVGAGGASVSLGLTSVLLLVAGFYQFTTLKESCLHECRAPLMFFMQYWRPGLAGAAELGLRLGAICIGCCWALMLLGFVGGVMNLAWMGIATVLMVVEKLPDLGRYVTRPLGAILIAAGLFAGAQALVQM